MDGPSTSGRPAGRPDGRKNAQLRSLMCERGVLQRADGSAQWTQGGTVVLAAVFGPRMTFSRKEDAERAVVEVTWRPRACSSGPREREMEQIIRRTVEGVVVLSLHPRAAISIVLQVISADGALLSAGLNAACAALVDAGVPMRAMFASITCGVRDGSLLLDPSAAEEADADAVASVAFVSTSPAPAAAGQAATQGPGGGDGAPDAVAGGATGAGAGVGAPRQQVCGAGVLSTLCEGRLPCEDYVRLLGVARRASERVAALQRRAVEQAFATLEAA